MSISKLFIKCTYVAPHQQFIGWTINCFTSSADSAVSFTKTFQNFFFSALKKKKVLKGNSSILQNQILTNILGVEKNVIVMLHFLFIPSVDMLKSLLLRSNCSLLQDQQKPAFHKVQRYQIVLLNVLVMTPRL